MTKYIIRGGEEGKARLRVISDALWPTSCSLLEGAGIRSGMACLDVGCGGGHVTLAMARLVGPSGMVTGVDMDRVKLGLAQQDAEREKIAHVSFRLLDANHLDYGGGYDLVYARFLLTHLNDPLSTLQRMVNAAKPGGQRPPQPLDEDVVHAAAATVIVVEDLDHATIFSYPICPAIAQSSRLYGRLARLSGGDPEIGPKLPALFRQAGLRDLQFSHIQPAFMQGEAKKIHEITLENVAPAILDAALASEAEIDSLYSDLSKFSQESETIVSFPRIFQVWARRQ